MKRTERRRKERVFILPSQALKNQKLPFLWLEAPVHMAYHPTGRAIKKNKAQEKNFLVLFLLSNKNSCLYVFFSFSRIALFHFGTASIFACSSLSCCCCFSSSSFLFFSIRACFHPGTSSPPPLAAAADTVEEDEELAPGACRRDPAELGAGERDFDGVDTDGGNTVVELGEADVGVVEEGLGFLQDCLGCVVCCSGA